MRSILMSLLILTFSGLASAQELHGGKLHDAMKIIGADFKAIAKESGDPAALPGLVAKAQEIRAQVLSVVGETPEELEKSVPANQLPLARLGYEKLMIQLAAQAVDLEVALRKGDLAAVKAALEAMDDTKADGHDQFKP